MLLRKSQVKSLNMGLTIAFCLFLISVATCSEARGVKKVERTPRPMISGVASATEPPFWVKKERRWLKIETKRRHHAADITSIY